MTSVITRFLAVTLFVALAALAPSSAFAAKKEKGAAKDPGLKGSITAIDKSAKTITVKGKAVIADETTVITRSGKTIAFDALKVGDDAEVSTFALGDKLTAVTIRVGGAPVASNTPSTETPKKKKKP